MIKNKMFTVFYTVKIACICVFMTPSISHSLCDTLMNSWNVFMYIYCETYVAGDAGVSDGGHNVGNGDVPENDDTDSEYSDVNLEDSGAGDITIKRKATTQKGVNTKMFHKEPHSTAVPNLFDSRSPF